MHDNNRALFDAYVTPRFSAGMKVLELGPGTFPSEFAKVAAVRGPTWHTLDIQHSPQLTYFTTDPYRFPIPDQSYDLLFSANVVEHVEAPWLWIKEVARVCKVGGLVITMNPTNWGYHAYPKDCWRIYPDGMFALYKEGGLEVEMSKCENLEGSLNRFRRRGWKWIVKQIIRREMGGEPFIPLDTITIGRKGVSR